MSEIKELTKKQGEAVDSLESEIQGMIDAGADVQPWLGSRDVMNPSTGEITGTRVTKNLNLVIPDIKQYERVEKALDFLKKSTRYVTGKFFGKSLIAISARVDELRGHNIIQFTEPNTGSYFNTASEDSRAKFERVFSADTPQMNAVKETVPATDDVPF